MKSWCKLGAMIGALLITIISIPAHADESSSAEIAKLQGQVDGINEQIVAMQPVLDALSKIKISGYIQSQFQLAQSDGISSYAGGNFPSGVHQRFSVRRGRVKVNYVGNLSQYVLQIDVTQGGIGIKDAYLSVTEPWTKSWQLWSGVFDRPFGFEISYSSSSREAPERTRMYQILFPGERELGFKVEYAPESGPMSFLRGKVGLFNGAGPTANENDNNKDLIGRIGVMLPFVEQNMELDAGGSFYMGKVRNQDKYLFSVEGTPKAWKVDSTAANKLKYFDRNYFGFDAQYYADQLPGLGLLGGTSLRTEFISGDQPTTKSSNSFYSPASGTTGLDLGLYQRKFSGYYVNLVQNLGMMDQLVVKYDSFDPNTDVSGDDIGATGSNLNSADIQYTTLGVGLVHHFDGNMKLVIYYDMPTNEKVNSAVSSGNLLPLKDNLKDNVLTVRMQYKF